MLQDLMARANEYQAVMTRSNTYVDWYRGRAVSPATTK